MLGNNRVLKAFHGAKDIEGDREWRVERSRIMRLNVQKNFKNNMTKTDKLKVQTFEHPFFVRCKIIKHFPGIIREICSTL